MTPTTPIVTTVFHRLHESGCFVIPNPWDIGSARVLAQLGFPRWRRRARDSRGRSGRPDNGVTLDEALEHFRAIAASVDMPVNGDFEGGFAIEPAGVAMNVTRAIDDRHRRRVDRRLDGRSRRIRCSTSISAVERIHAARQAIDRERHAA